ncbi:RNA-directed DNA polymerase, eukaryota [Tanacetum coccineum]
MYFIRKEEYVIYTKTEKNIFEEFKIIFRGKTSWIRAKETPGWVPDFMEENDDEEQSDVDSKEGEFKVHERLFMKKDTTENEINSEQTMKYPPGFTPKEGSEEIGMYAEESKSVNFVNLSDHKAEEANKDGHEGQVMGYQDGTVVKCQNMTEIIESQGLNGGESMNFLSLNIQGLAQKAKKDWVKELCVKNKVNFMALQETKMENMELFSMLWDYLTYEIGKWKGEVGYYAISTRLGKREAPCDKTNVMLNMMMKLKFLKAKIREWNKSNMLSVKNVKAKYKEELEAFEAIIDRGDGNEEIVNKRTKVVNNIQKFDKIHSSEMA